MAPGKRLRPRGYVRPACPFPAYAAEVRQLLLVGACHPGGALGAADAVAKLLALRCSRDMLREGWQVGWTPAECAQTFRWGLLQYQATVAPAGARPAVLHS